MNPEISAQIRKPTKYQSTISMKVRKRMPLVKAKNVLIEKIDMRMVKDIFI